MNFLRGLRSAFHSDTPSNVTTTTNTAGSKTSLKHNHTRSGEIDLTPSSSSLANSATSISTGTSVSSGGSSNPPQHDSLLCRVCDEIINAEDFESHSKNCVKQQESEMLRYNADVQLRKLAMALNSFIEDEQNKDVVLGFAIDIKTIAEKYVSHL